MIKFYAQIVSDDEGVNVTLVDINRNYVDIESFELHNDALAYQIATIAREELEKLRKEKFLRDNPELNIVGEIDDLTASTPF